MVATSGDQRRSPKVSCPTDDDGSTVGDVTEFENTNTHNMPKRAKFCIVCSGKMSYGGGGDVGTGYCLVVVLFSSVSIHTCRVIAVADLRLISVARRAYA